MSDNRGIELRARVRIRARFMVRVSGRYVRFGVSARASITTIRG